MATTRTTISTPQRVTPSALNHPRPRPSISALQSPSSPHTPLGRSITSLYGSPQAGFRADEETLILTLGSRNLCIGFAGEIQPRALLNFDASTSKRVGDWTPPNPRKRKRWTGKEEDEWKWWGSEEELYRLDIRECDLPLMEAKLQRALRNAMITRVLAEPPKNRKMMIAVPSSMPLPILERVLAVVFSNNHTSTATLLPASVLSTVAAGLRSALVIEMGWSETIITAVYEYREVARKSSIRAGKLLSFEMRVLLDQKLRQAQREVGGSTGLGINFEDTEEVLKRIGWCRSLQDDTEDDPQMTIPPLSSTGCELQVPFSYLAQPADAALFSSDSVDDNELPLHELAYHILLSLPVDARRICMSRIVITGGVSQLPGVKTRLLEELEQLIKSRGWDHVKSYGSAEDKVPRVNKLRQRPPLSDVDPNAEAAKQDPEEPVAASLREHDSHPSFERFEKLSITDQTEHEGGFVKAIETLGAWVGASLVANLRVKGPEVEKEKFLSQGLDALGGEYAGWSARIMT